MIDYAEDVRYGNLQDDMALNSYGYGQWKAPYWFIGPEQGKGRNEPADNKKRIEAWRELGKLDLCDCRCFHEKIGDISRHRERPALQSTWKQLILLLMAYLGEDIKTENLRAYQRDHWGMSNGETCVIELSGIAVKDLKTPVKRKQFRPERIKYIREMLTPYRPRLVLMYGLSAKEDWQQIAGCELNENGLVERDSTIFGLARHPVSLGTKNQYWIDLGHECRNLHGCL